MPIWTDGRILVGRIQHEPVPTERLRRVPPWRATSDLYRQPMSIVTCLTVMTTAPSAADQVKGQYQNIATAQLDLDLDNPRLPEEVKGTQASNVLTYLWDHGSLEELAQSLIDNGYFGHEPLIVVQNSERFTVLEGNRRLATLQVLLGYGASQELDLSFSLEPAPSAAQLDGLQTVPCFVVSSVDEVHNFLGFRHIGGLKMWSAEAKARYLYSEVLHTVANGSSDTNIFRAVGRRVGSNAQGVRNPFLALSLLIHARDEYGIDTGYVQRDRFGVWVRCMNSRDLRDFIGLASASTYSEVLDAVNAVNGSALQELIQDLAPHSGSPPILIDSRDVTVYGQVLANDRARTVLRETLSLRVARQVVERAGLPERVERVNQTIRLILDEVQEYGAPPETIDSAERLFKLARSLRNATRDTVDDSDSG